MDVTQRFYRLTCYVKAFSKRVDDFNGVKNVSYNTLIVCLVPEKNDEFFRFHHAWVPENQNETPEVVGEISHPYSPYARLAVRMGGDLNNKLGGFDGPYLFVMTTGMAQYLASKKSNERIAVKILPEGDESLADFSVDAEGDFDLVSGQELHPYSEVSKD